jgi:hypothetical protein
MTPRDALYWIRGHRASTAGLLLVVLGFVALVSLARRAHHLPLKPSGASSLSAAAGADRASASASGVAASSQAGTEQSTRSARMRTEFENAPNYLEFIAQAMSRPQEGGKFYALLAWRRCNDLNRHKGAADTHTGNDAFHDGALALIQDIEKRCTGVQEAYADIQALYSVAMDQRGGRDLLMPAGGRGIVVPSGRDTANADIDAAIRTADRWAEAEALQNNVDFLDMGNSAGDDGVDRQLHEWGAEIVACELVSSCRGGIEVSLHCVGTGDCAHDDYRDVVRAEVPDTHKVLFDTMLEGLHLRMGLTPGRIDADDHARGLSAPGDQLIASSSTSNTSVASAGMTPPAPRGP